MKLTAELIPSSTWGINLRSALSRAEWDKVRRRCYQEANYVCEVCGGVGKRHPVECHEVWHFDDKTLRQTLLGVVALCTNCHVVKHIGRAFSVGQGDKAVKWLAYVNGISMKEAYDYVEEVYAEWTSRNRFKWTVDMNWIDTYLS